jgi:hypothetical protein
MDSYQKRLPSRLTSTKGRIAMLVIQAVSTFSFLNAFVVPVSVAARPPSDLQVSRDLLQSADRAFDLRSGQLGNLSYLRIVGSNLTVIVVGGKQNKIRKASHPIALKELTLVGSDAQLSPKPRHIEISMNKSVGTSGGGNASANNPPSAAWIVIETSTLQDISVAQNASLLLKRLTLPYLRVSTPASEVVLTDINLGTLSMNANGASSIVASGVVDTLTMGAAQAGAMFYMHDLTIKKSALIEPLSPDQFYSVNTAGGPVTYKNPAATPGNQSRYRLEVQGDVNKVLVPGPGGAQVKVLAASSTKAAQDLKQRLQERIKGATVE